MFLIQSEAGAWVPPATCMPPGRRNGKHMPGAHGLDGRSGSDGKSRSPLPHGAEGGWDAVRALSRLNQIIRVETMEKEHSFNQVSPESFFWLNQHVYSYCCFKLADSTCDNGSKRKYNC